MKKFVKNYTILLLLLVTQNICAQEKLSVRVMSMNIKEGGSCAGYLSAPYAKIISEYKPDFVCLQEVDYRTARNGKRDFLNELAVETGMFPYYCQSFSYQGGAYGVAILSRYPFFKAKKRISEISGAREARACGWIYVQMPGADTIRVASVHLALESTEITIRNIADINKYILEDRKVPTLMIGDYNAVPDSDAIAYCKLNWQEIGAGAGPTIPATNPKKQLDYIMGHPKKWTCSYYQIIARPGLSDHCFIIADLEYEKK